VAGGGIAYELGHDSPYLAPAPHPAVRADPAQAAVALESLGSALAPGAAAAPADLAPAGDQRSAPQLRAGAGNAHRLGVHPTLRYVDQTGGISADGRWTATADLTWRYAGDSGTALAHAEVDVGLETNGDRVAVTGFGVGGGRLPVWLSGPVVVRRAPGVLVVAAGEGALVRTQAARYLRLARTAVVVVRRVLPGWRTPLVVEVPGSSRDLDRSLDAEAGHTHAVAAVTAPVDGTTTGGAPVHVFVNPEVFDRLRPAGAQVVLSHEAVHVATDAARSPAPTWLVEGFADWVALRDVQLPSATTAGQVIGQVRRHGVPDALPTSQDFDTDSRHLGATYEAAWLVCVVLGDRGDQQALVGFYDDVDRGSSVRAALRDRFGLTVGALTRLWQERLARLAG
jgi:hypothetical protein